MLCFLIVLFAIMMMMPVIHNLPSHMLKSIWVQSLTRHYFSLMSWGHHLRNSRKKKLQFEVQEKNHIQACLFKASSCIGTHIQYKCLENSHPHVPTIFFSIPSWYIFFSSLAGVMILWSLSMAAAGTAPQWPCRSHPEHFAWSQKWAGRPVCPSNSSSWSRRAHRDSSPAWACGNPSELMSSPHRCSCL